MSNLPNVQRVSPLVSMASRFNVEPGKLLGILRNTVIRADKTGRQASDEEVAAFVIVANEYGLNPFTKEIYAFPSKGGGIQPIVGVDGWAKLVNHPDRHFDGLEFDEVRDDEGHLVAITCSIFVHGRTRPVKVTEYFSECNRNTDPWKTHPCRMLRHKAFVQCARLCFGLTGLMDEDEDEGELAAGVHLTPPKAYIANGMGTSRKESLEAKMKGEIKELSQQKQTDPPQDQPKEEPTRERQPGEDDPE